MPLRTFLILTLALFALTAFAETEFLKIQAPEKIEVARDAKFAAEWDKKNFSHELFQQLLQTRVSATGEVDYAALMKDPLPLDEYLHRLQHTDPEQFETKPAKYAYWVNAYNAFTMKAVLQLLPPDASQWSRFSLKGVQPSIWKTTKFAAGGKDVTLHQIENEILRPTFKDPRVHAVVNCGSQGCPKLQRFAFTAEKLEAQLDDAAAAWVNDNARNQLQGDGLKVSKIFDWYAGDFEGGPEKFIAKYTTDEALKAKLNNRELKVQYLDYNWGLNQKPADAAAVRPEIPEFRDSPERPGRAKAPDKNKPERSDKPDRPEAPERPEGS